MLRKGILAALVVLAIGVGGVVAVTGEFVTFDQASSGTESEPTPDATPKPTVTPDGTPTPVASTPGATPTQDATPTPDATQTPESTPTPEPTPTPDGVRNEDGVNVVVFVGNDSNPIKSGQLTISDANGTAVEEFDLNTRPAATFEGLEPGENYTAEVSEAGIGNVWPNVSRSFDPGETDKLELVAGFEFAAADSYRFNLREIRSYDLGEDDPKRYHARGKFDDGNAFIEHAEYEWWEDSFNFQKLTTTLDIEIKNMRFRKGGFADDQWKEVTYLTYNPVRMPEQFPTQKSLAAYDDRDERTFLGTQTLTDSTVPDELIEENPANEELANITSIPDAINGTRVHVYQLSFEGYSEWAETEYDYGPGNVTVYVDVETGYVLRWQSTEKLRGGGMDPSLTVIDFWAHDSVSVSPENYDLPSGS